MQTAKRVLIFVLAIVMGELIPIVMLVALVFFYGLFGGTRPPEEYAQSAGLWFGPIAGALTTGVMAWFLYRKDPHAVQRGIALGATIVAIDLAIVAAYGAPFMMIFAISGAAKVTAGAVGGYLALRAGSPSRVANARAIA